MGPRFSNPILQALLTCIRRVNQTDNERKVMVIATCTHNVARDLDLDQQFDFVRNMPMIKKKEEFERILKDSGNAELCKPNLRAIVDAFPIDSVKSKGVGISDLLTVLELAIDENKQITPESLLIAWRSKFTSRSIYDDDLGLDDF